MAFKLSTVKQKFSVNIEVLTPNEKCGHDKSTFVATFIRSDANEMERLLGMSMADVAREKLVGWDQFLDDEGQPVPFNDETKEALLSIPEVTAGMAVSFWEAFSNQKLKNLKR